MALEITYEVAKEMKDDFDKVISDITKLTEEFMDELYDMASESGCRPYKKLLEDVCDKLVDTIPTMFKRAFEMSQGSEQDVTFHTLKQVEVQGEKVIRGTALDILHEIISSIGDSITGWRICEFNPPHIDGEIKPIDNDVERFKEIVSKYMNKLRECMEDDAKELDGKTDNEVYVPMVNIIRNAKDFIMDPAFEGDLIKKMETLVEDYNNAYKNF